MLTPFVKAFTEPDPEEPSAPEVVSIEDLSGDQIEAAEAELEAEEEWQALCPDLPSDGHEWLDTGGVEVSDAVVHWQRAAGIEGPKAP